MDNLVSLAGSPTASGLEGFGKWFISRLIVPFRKAWPALRWLTRADAVSCMRIVLMIPAILLFVLGHYFTSAIPFTIAVLLDIVDGWIARHDGPTQFGAFLDSTLDKGATIPFLGLQLWVGFFSHWFLIISALCLIIIDLVNLRINIKNYLMIKRSEQTVESGAKTKVNSNPFGKIKMWATSIGIIALLIGKGPESYLLYEFTYFGYFAIIAAVPFACLSLRGKLSRK